MATKSLWDQIENIATRFLNSKYYLDDTKTICQDYTKNIRRLNLLTFTDGLLVYYAIAFILLVAYQDI